MRDCVVLKNRIRLDAAQLSAPRPAGKLWLQIPEHKTLSFPLSRQHSSQPPLIIKPAIKKIILTSTKKDNKFNNFARHFHRRTTSTTAKMNGDGHRGKLTLDMGKETRTMCLSSLSQLDNMLTRSRSGSDRHHSSRDHNVC